MIAPTNCSTMHATGTATGVDRSTAALRSRFSVGSWKNLKFSPKLTLTVGADGRTGRGGSTPLRQRLRRSRVRASEIGEGRVAAAARRA
jgi:hypothetical protein